MEEVQMANKSHEKYLLSMPGHKGNAKQTTLRFYLPSVRMATIKNTNNNKCWQGDGVEGTLIQCRWECKLVQPLWKPVWRLLKKTKNRTAYDQEIPLLRICLKEYVRLQ
jgi:hypothetical protein